MVVAVLFEHVVSPVVEIVPVNAGDASGALRFRAVRIDVVNVFMFPLCTTSTHGVKSLFRFILKKHLIGIPRHGNL